MCTVIKRYLSCTQLLDSRIFKFNDSNRPTLFHQIRLLHMPMPVVELLLRHGADIDAQDSFERTPLNIAAAMSSYSIAKFLLQKGAQVNTPDRSDRCLYAQQCGQPNGLSTQIVTELRLLTSFDVMELIQLSLIVMVELR